MLKVLLFVAGLVALITGASLLVRGASGWQPLGGVSPLVVSNSALDSPIRGQCRLAGPQQCL